MSVSMNLPDTPHVGIAFRPDSTDSLGTVTKVVGGGRQGPSVTYSYDHAPEVKHTRPWHEVRRIAWAV